MIVTPATADQLMCTAAHRYCLGRSTYIVSSCLEWLRATWGYFDSGTRNIMVRDTVVALMNHDAGQPMDESGWLEFARWTWPLLDDKGRLWVRKVTAHENRPWPLDAERIP